MNKQKQIGSAITAVYHARLACLGFALLHVWRGDYDFAVIFVILIFIIHVFLPVTKWP